MSAARTPLDPATQAILSARCWELREAFDTLKHQAAPDSQQRCAAEAYIEACYEYQLARFGKLKARIFVASLLR